MPKVNVPEAVRSLVLEEIASVNTALPVVVLEYVPSQCTVTVKPLLNKEYADGAIGEAPTLFDLPVIFPSAGGGLISFPIKQGDTGLAIFCQRSIDDWTYGDGSTVTPKSKQMHALNDGVFIPGLYTVNTHLSPDPDNVQIKFSGSTITIKTDGVVEIDAPTVIVNGDAIVNGNATVNGDVEVDGNIECSGEGNFVGGVKKNNVPYNHP